MYYVSVRASPKTSVRFQCVAPGVAPGNDACQDLYLCMRVCERACWGERGAQGTLFSQPYYRTWVTRDRKDWKRAAQMQDRTLLPHSVWVCVPGRQNLQGSNQARHPNWSLVLGLQGDGGKQVLHCIGATSGSGSQLPGTEHSTGRQRCGIGRSATTDVVGTAAPSRSQSHRKQGNEPAEPSTRGMATRHATPR